MAFEWVDRLPTLAAERVELRPLSGADTADVFAIFSDPQVMRYWDSLPMAAPQDAAKYIDEIAEGFRSRTIFQWGTADRHSGRVIGTCTLLHVSPVHERAEIGFALARAHWGQGLATEAVGALLRFAFEDLGLHRLEADADPRNERSVRLLERLGFRREGILRERYWVNGERQDTMMLGLLAPEWRALGADRK